MISVLLMVVPFLIGWVLDILLGDPVWMPHPGRLIGSFIQSLEPVLLGAFPKTPKGEQLAGNLLALLVPLVSLLVTALLLAFSWLIHPGVWFALETLLCYQLIGTRGLRDESMRVCKLLESREEQGDLSRARLALSRIASRDTGKLNRQEITKTAVESVAENTGARVAAPMFFLAIGGGALGIFQKSVDSLARTAEYKDESHRYYGIASIKLDDICGFIPSRLAALLMLFSTWLGGLDYKNAVRVFKRDRFNHLSPNSAQTEAVCAGALGISLGGGAFYEGVFNLRPDIGDASRPVETGDIRAANRLMIMTSIFCVLLLGFLKLAVLYIMMLG